MSDAVAVWLLILGIECCAWLVVLMARVVVGYVR